MPELRGLYPVPYVRALLHLVLVSAFLLGLLSVMLRRSQAPGHGGHVARARRRAARRLARSDRRRARRRAVPRARLVPPEPDRVLGGLHSARAPVRAASRPARLPALLAHGPVVLLRQHAVRAGDDAADAEARDDPVLVGVAPGPAGVGRRAAVRAPVRRDPVRRGPDTVLGTPRVPRACPGSGASTASTTRRRRWTGWPARACTWSTSP